MGIQLNGNNDNISAVDGDLSITGIATFNNAVSVGNSVTATAFYGDGTNLTGISASSDNIIEGNTKAEVVDAGSNGHFKVETEGIERFRVISTGETLIKDVDLIIGSGQNTQAQLNFFSNNDNASGRYSRIRKNYNSPFNFEYFASTSDSDQSHVFYSDLTTERVRISSDGNIGIHDTSPPWPLSIRKAVSGGTVSGGAGIFMGIQDNYPAIQMNTASDAHGCIIDMGASGVDFKGRIEYINGDDYMRFFANGNEGLRIDSNGKVKIGNSGGTPDGKLHIDEIGNGDIVAELTSGSPMFTYRNGTNAWFHAGKHPSDDAFVVTQGGTTTATELLRITSAGRIGIGENSPDGMLHLTGSVPAIFLEDTSGTHGQTIIEQNNDNLKIRCDAGNASSGTGSNIRFEVDSTERLRIQSNNGDILFGNYLGTTNQPRVFFLDPTGNFPDQSNRIGLRISNGQSDASIRAYSNSNNWDHVKFYSTHLSGGTIVVSGSISQSGGNTISYNQTSDYRLKENEVLISDGITRLKQLKPYRFNWKTDTSKKVDGFYAHEVSGIVPDAVTGEKDAVVTQSMIDAGKIDEAIGTPVYQQMDHAKLVPLITAALQETVAKIETLETKVETLEQDNELLRKKVLENVVRIVNLENDSHEH